MAAAWTLLLPLALLADPRAQLEALKSRKAAEEAAASALQQREGSLLSALDAAEQSWARAEAAARDAAQEQDGAARRLAEARAAEVADRARLATLQQELGPRLLARARRGAVSELRVLAASTSLADLVKRRYLWERVTSGDLRLMRDAGLALERRQAARAAVEREAAEVERLARAAQQEREEAAARRSEHQDLLGAVRTARSLHERAAAEAAEQEAKLARFVAALPPPAHGAPLHTGFSRLRGRLPLPVDGTVAVGFGPVLDPRSNTVTVQKGIDLRASPGAQVRAIAPGRVAHAGWFKGYGNLVIVDHGDGYHTLVAHLAALSTAMGEEVAAGSVLGSVGDSGSPKGPYVYFEIRENGRPVDPRGWVGPSQP